MYIPNTICPKCGKHLSLFESSYCLECGKQIYKNETGTNAYQNETKAEFEAEWQADMCEDKFGVADCLNIIERHISRKDCRNCDKWTECECGEKAHANGTSQGYSIGECKDFKHISGKEQE